MSDYHEDETTDEMLIKVGEAYEVGCSIGDLDSIGAIVIQHRETGEKRVLIEGLEDFSGDGFNEDTTAARDAHADRLMECLAENVVYTKTMLMPADARRFGAALIRMADECEGVDTPLVVGDWNMKELG